MGGGWRSTKAPGHSRAESKIRGARYPDCFWLHCRGSDYGDHSGDDLHYRNPVHYVSLYWPRAILVCATLGRLAVTDCLCRHCLFPDPHSESGVAQNVMRFRRLLWVSWRKPVKEFIGSRAAGFNRWLKSSLSTHFGRSEKSR